MLTVEPWVPPETVKKYYQEIRHSVMGGSGSVRDRTLAVFRFVVSHMEVKGTNLTVPNLKRLAELWNEEYPEGHNWHFSSYRDFNKSYHRGREAIAFPLSE